MTRPPVTWSRLLPAALAMTAPAAAVMVVMTAAGLVGAWVAAGVVALVGALSVLLVRPYLADLSAVTAYVRDLAAGGEPTPPEIAHLRMAEDLVGALAQLRRAWRRQRDELESSLASTETLLDSLPDPLVMLDGQRRVVRANLAARRLFGRDVGGRDLAAVLREPAILEATDAVIAGQPGRDVEFTLPVPVERRFRARVEPLPRKALDGTVALLALNDVTAARRMEQMRADFVANASHELRTPLSALVGFIETLRGPARDDPEAGERFLAIMHEQASRMSRLVNDLLSLSRIELNEHTQPGERVDLARVLRRVTDAVDLQARARGMAIVVELPADLPEVLGEADELTQLFQNLVDNAVKYGRDGTPVEVTARVVAGWRGGTGVAVSVRDHGEGIAQEHLPRLTERFYRVDTARSRKLGGTGLGLAIVKHVVNRHRGRLSIESTVGVGSVFTVVLPAADAAAPAPERRAETPS